MLLLANYRPEYQHRWGNKTYYSQLRIDPLQPGAAWQIVGSRSTLLMRSAFTRPFLMMPGQLAISGTCVPAAVVVPLPPL